MRVLFVVWPGSAHLHPSIPLAWALQSAGHEVRVGSHHSMAATITSLGLPAVAVGDQAQPAKGPGAPYPEAELPKLEGATGLLALDPAQSDPWEIFRHFLLPGIWDFLPPGTPPEHPRPGVDDLVDFTRRWQPDLVIWDPCWPAAAVAAAASGAAHARLLYSQDYFAWTVDRYAASAAVDVLDHPLAEALRPVADRYGVELTPELLVGQFSIDTLPDGFGLPTTTRRVPVRMVFTPTQTVLPEWLLEQPQRPRVALSLGLSQREFIEGGWDYIPGLMEAVSTLDIEVVATLNAAQLADLDSLPANVRTVDYLPLNQLLPTCSALVHHGGVGTFASAANHRVPQLITDMEAPVSMKYPVAPSTAAYVTGRGAGLTLDIAGSPDAMRKQLELVLTDPSFRQGADRVYEDLLAMPSPVDVVPVLERLTAQMRPRCA
ncbi:nucleotide disphospho-sugar-binding domain-containing protein [Actinoplanes sp. NPDC049802]|uniref:nucleotide disphospho-sugar-binding domain-containing protein n=1 Tax=Actinoplanes sp. NPDC049802 TaxID=3154742 RepID=UPI0033E0EC45